MACRAAALKLTKNYEPAVRQEGNRPPVLYLPFGRYKIIRQFVICHAADIKLTAENEPAARQVSFFSSIFILPCGRKGFGI
jgi:hypothetical protein